MSLITRCPACQTLFKVVPDQLRVSGGWVRCGMCDEIFDAASHAQQEPPAPLTPEQEQAVVAPTPEAEPAVDLELPYAGESVLATSEEEFRVEEVATADKEAVAPSATSTESIVDIASTPASEPEQGPEPEPEPEPEPITRHEPEPEPESAPEPVVSFMKPARGHSVWHKTWVRVALGLAGMGLLSGLGLQFVVHERNRIAASTPQLRPMMAALCNALECTLSPLQQIESIVIESSAFTRVRGDVYRLSFAVKNTSAVELALPSLELTLTDAQDQAVIRRVFTPQELAAVSGVLAPEAEWTGAVSLAVRASAGSGAERIAGYRVLAFYP